MCNVSTIIHIWLCFSYPSLTTITRVLGLCHVYYRTCKTTKKYHKLHFSSSYDILLRRCVTIFHTSIDSYTVSSKQFRPGLCHVCQAKSEVGSLEKFKMNSRFWRQNIILNVQTAYHA